ncbi:MAG TPA: putative glycolipid-binding domain-containing protein [Candidatus Thermoplasmatota archaeon]|nr:putative glycolipid-binding domain-containing protein [Candidatus Thermoplasmatota archaeon]
MPAPPAAAPARTARWSAWDHSGLEVARLLAGPDGIQLIGELSAEPGVRPWAQYAIACDASWRTLDVRVQLVDGRDLWLGSDGAGTWTRDGQPAPGLAGATDVDLSGTPMTNTLPIRRLGLGIGSRARIACAYVDLPSLAVSLDPQRYTRLSDRRYRFESPASGFARDIDVDEEGLVVSYPGLFRRVG